METKSQTLESHDGTRWTAWPAPRSACSLWTEGEIGPLAYFTGCFGLCPTAWRSASLACVATRLAGSVSDPLELPALLAPSFLEQNGTSAIPKDLQRSPGPTRLPPTGIHTDLSSNHNRARTVLGIWVHGPGQDGSQTLSYRMRQSVLTLKPENPSPNKQLLWVRRPFNVKKHTK